LITMREKRPPQMYIQINPGTLRKTIRVPGSKRKTRPVNEGKTNTGLRTQDTGHWTLKWTTPGLVAHHWRCN